MASKNAVVAQGLECNLCFELLKEPKLLSCTHTFCQQCLVYLHRSQVELHGNTLVCPLCRGKTFIRDGDVSKLKTNIPIQCLVDDIETVRKACSGCAPGKVAPATKYCLDGCGYMCEDCLEGHMRCKTISHHELVDIEEINSGKVKVKQFCLKHPKGELEWFCLNCEKPICYKCTVSIHTGEMHKLEELCEYEEKFEEKIKTTLKDAGSAVKKIKASINAISQEKKKVKAYFDGRIEDIEQAYNDGRRQIDEKRMFCIAECNRQRQNMTSEIDDMENTIMMKMSGIQNASKLIENGRKGFLGGKTLDVQRHFYNDLQEKIEKLSLSEVRPQAVTSKAAAIKFITEKCDHNFGNIVHTGKKSHQFQMKKPTLSKQGRTYRAKENCLHPPQSQYPEPEILVSIPKSPCHHTEK